MAWSKTRIANLTRKKETGVYYARAKVGGKVMVRSLGTTKLDIARVKLPGKLSEIRNIDQSMKISGLEDSIDKWWARKQAEDNMQPETINYYEKMFLFVFKELPKTSTISDAQAIMWWVEHVKGVVSNNYANNILGMMRGAMVIEVEAGVRNKNPFTNIKKLKVGVPDLDLPSRKKFKKVVKTIRKGKHWSADESADLVEFLAYSGLRISELNELKWKDVKKNEIIVRGKELVDDKGNRAGTKSGKLRRVPISKALRAVIKRRKELNKEVKSLLVFKIKCPKKSLAKACVTVKCQHLCMHKLRHMFATVCIESGVDIPTVSKWLGHQDGGALAMKVYGHLRDEHSQLQMKSVDF